MQTSFYTEDELSVIGFKRIGYNVKISRKASIYSPEEIEIGNNVRIDDFCILSGKIKMGNYIHCAAFSAVFAPCEVTFGDFSGISSRVSIYSGSDSYVSDCLINPTVPDKYRNIIIGPVSLGKYATIGASSIVLPGVSLGEGCTVGALSLVNRDLEAWWLFAGTPAKKIKEREHKKIDEYVKEIEASQNKI
jgi:acetyltransferase-like isoleucine patch superfamily enzyme